MSDSTIIKQTQYWVESVIVGLNFCPFAKREIERGDRLVGLARGQYDVVHSFGEYDLKIDTSNDTVEQSVSDYLV